MPILSVDQIAGYASEAGFRGEDLKTAVAVAMAESGGNTDAHNAKPPDDSYGLWQINMLGSLGPARRKQFNIKSNNELFDPRVNARAAYMIWKGSGWKAWTTYTRGTYKQTTIQDLIKNLDPRNVGKEIKEAGKELNPINGVSEAINAFGSTIFKGIANMAGIGVALALLVLGIVLLIMSNGRARKTADVAVNLIPGGAAAKNAIKGAAKNGVKKAGKAAAS